MPFMNYIYGTAKILVGGRFEKLKEFEFCEEKCFTMPSTTPHFELFRWSDIEPINGNGTVVQSQKQIKLTFALWSKYFYL